jgi:hypothetical protein
VTPSRRTLASAAAIGLVAADLIVMPFGPTAADPDNSAYAALGAGRTVELPLFEPGIHFGSVYHYYAMQQPRERPSGYSTLVPERAFGFFFTLNRLNCGIWLPGDERRLRELGVRQLLFHRGSYAQAGRPGAWFAWRGLERGGYRAAAQGGSIWLFPLTPGPETTQQDPPVAEPERPGPSFCEGWRGWTMKERDGGLWVFGGTDLELVLSAPGWTLAGLRVDGGALRPLVVDRSITVHVELAGRRWHSLLLSIPRLFLDVKPAQGLTIEKLTYLESTTGATSG